ncbi:MAG: relaxase/mobilization nuclease domain-containing protein, partial [Oscillospiraceae bacterium]|nr:relaxase/mobilization nuclease domain-containing protein [Oscillospiraceae bacterium]
GVHTNTENLHIHFIVNSVGMDGKKIHQNNKFMSGVLHPCVNKFAKKRTSFDVRQIFPLLFQLYPFLCRPLPCAAAV